MYYEFRLPFYLQDTYQFTLDKMPPLQDTTNNALKLKNLTTLVRLLLSDLKEGCAKSDDLFRQELNVNYIQKAYEIYEEKVFLVFVFMLILSCKFNSASFSHGWVNVYFLYS